MAGRERSCFGGLKLRMIEHGVPSIEFMEVKFMRIEHIAMYVNNLEKTKDFFVKYFHAISNEGYHNKKTDFRSYFLSFDGKKY